MVEKLIAENRKRMNLMYASYDPISGENALGDRTILSIKDFSIKKQFVPKPLLDEPLIKLISQHKSIERFAKANKIKINDRQSFCEKIKQKIFFLRCKHDFLFWAYTCVRIKNKVGGKMIPFRLKHEQLCLLSELEDMRLKNIPIRIILLKARQWGGSTLVQIYMAWIQLLWKEGFYSTIIAQTLATSRKIKAMYAKFLESYPSFMLDIEGDQQIRFTPYEGSHNDFIVTYGNGTNKQKARDIVISVGTYEKPDATRGGDTALIHYSEVALWNETRGKKPEDIIRSVSGGLMEAPYTIEVLESTANGTGNFFHTEYERAKRGESNRRAVFIPFWKIEHDAIPVDDELEFAHWLLRNKDKDSCDGGWLDSGKYYWYLWQLGATFNAINWYRIKRKTFNNHADMASEAPADDIEAFKHSGEKVFDIYQIEALRKNCKPPKWKGEVSGDNLTGKSALTNLHFSEDNAGALSIWKKPDTSEKVKHRYLVVVDIGGRSTSSDYSVITVIDRLPMIYGGKIEIIAEWHGHTYHDYLAWKATQIAKWYNNALLVIEANTLETKDKERDTEGYHSGYVLDLIADHYKNLYFREGDAENIYDDAPRKYGFHTNTATKPIIIDNLQNFVRDNAWIERNILALDEFAFYEKKQNGSFGAINGKHDDLLMTRAIGFYISNKMPIPVIINK